MLKSVFSGYKGFHLPRDSVDWDDFESGPPRARTRAARRAQTEGTPISGFDQLTWDHTGSQNNTIVYSGSVKPSCASESSDDEDDEPKPQFFTEDQIDYDQYVGDFSYSTEPSQPVDEALEARPKKGKKGQKPLSKKMERKARKEEKKQKRQQRRGGDTPASASDADKVKVLSNLYREACSYLESSLKYYDVSVYKEDLYNLTDDEWLNDNNLAFVYEYLTRSQLIPRLSAKFKPGVPAEKISESIILLKPSMSYLLMHTPDPASLKGVIPPIERASFVFLPVNDNDDVEMAEGGSHWSLVVASVHDNTCFVYDSMALANERESLVLIDQFGKYMDRRFKIRENMHTPQQDNGSDCGIMVCQVTSILVARLLDCEEDEPLSFDLTGTNLSPVDGRISVMGTLLNLLKAKKN